MLAGVVWPCACSCPEIGARCSACRCPWVWLGGFHGRPPLPHHPTVRCCCFWWAGNASGVGLHVGWVVRCSSQENSRAVSSLPFEAQGLPGHDVTGGEGPGAALSPLSEVLFPGYEADLVD